MNDENLIIAAILHDTIEDTETPPVEIDATFGRDTLSIVLEVSDDKSLKKADRKRLQVETAPKKSPQAKQLKLADKTCNIRDMTLECPADWPQQRKVEYLDWAEQVATGRISRLGGAGRNRMLWRK